MSVAHTFKRALILGCLAFAMFFALSCQNDNNDTGTGTSPYSFSLHFTEGFPPPNSTVWVILHNLAGDAVLGVRRLSQDGTVDFGSVGSDRISFTIARVTTGGTSQWVPIWLTSLMDVAAGAWTLDWGESEDTLGYANITLTFPKDLYDEGWVNLPNMSSWLYLGVDSASQATWTGPVHSLEESNKLSLFVYISGPSGSHCGWATNQSFVSGSSNSYSLQLDQPVLSQTITSNRPLFWISLGACRGSSWATYRQYSDFRETDTTQFAVEYSAFPANKWSLEGEGSSNGEHFYFNYILSSLPTSLNIPEYGVTADYNESAQRFENIAVGGPADDLMTWYWAANTSAGWVVVASGDSQSLGMPAVPDSVLAALTLDPSALRYPYIRLEDWDTANNFDDAINILYRSSAPHLSLFTAYYGAERYFSPTAAPIRRPNECREHTAKLSGFRPRDAGFSK